MNEIFQRIEEKLKSFTEHGEDNYFSSDINSLYAQLVNSHPEIPGVRYPLEELQSYANKLYVAESDEQKQKYYQLSLSKLGTLIEKAERAGVI